MGLFTLAKLVVDVDADISGFARNSRLVHRELTGLARMADRVGSRLTRAFSFTAQLTGAGALVGGFGNALRRTVMTASALNETMTKTQVVLGSGFDRALKVTNQLTEEFGFQKGVILDAMSSFALMGKAAGYADDKATDLATTMTRLAMDASSFYDVPLQTALIKIRSGLAGQAMPLRAFGVLLSAAAVRNKAFSMGLAKTYAQLTDQVKVLARAKLIEEGLSAATGDLERTQGSFANRVRKVQGQVDNMMASLGMKILPIFGAIVDSISKLLGNLSGFLEDNSEAIQGWAQRVAHRVSLVGLVWKKFPEFVAVANKMVEEKMLQVGEVIRRVGEGIRIYWGNVWGDFSTAAQNALNYLKNLFLGFSTYLTSLFASLGANLAGTMKRSLFEMVEGLGGPTKAALGAWIPGAKQLLAGAPRRKPEVPPIAGDTSGLTDAFLNKDRVQAADWKPMDHLFRALPHLGVEIEKLVDNLHKANMIDFLRDRTWGDVRRMLEAPERLKTNREQLAASNARRARPLGLKANPMGMWSRLMGGLGVTGTGFPEDKENPLKEQVRSKVALGFANATKVAAEHRIRRPGSAGAREKEADAGRQMAARKAQEARGQARGLGRLAGYGGGAGGGLGRLALGLAEAGIRRAEAAPTASSATGAPLGRGARGLIRGIAGAVSGAVAGPSGLLGVVSGLARQATAGQKPLANRGFDPTRSRRRGRRGSGVPGQGDFGGEFKSEFAGYADFGKQVSAAALNRGASQDPAQKQVGLLEQIAGTLGSAGAGAGGSVQGLLSAIKNKSNVAVAAP